MARIRLSKERIGRILGAKHREAVQAPFYYAPRFLDQVREQLQRRLASRGGRPGVAEWQMVRKTRYSKRTWAALRQMATVWSRAGTSVSPAQVAARIVEDVVGR
jgi:hypothetical protein